MSRLPSSKSVETILAKHGFVFISAKGSHAKYRKTGSPTLTVIVPINKKEIPLGTLRSVVRQASMGLADFE